MHDGLESTTEDLWSFASGGALDPLIALARRALRAPEGFLATVREPSPRLPGPDDPSGRQFGCPDALWRAVIARNAPVLSNDVAATAASGSRTAMARAFLGVPVHDGEGRAIGALCVVDGMPRHWDENDGIVLADLARLALIHVALRREIALRHEAEAEADAARLAKDTVLVDVNHELRTPLQSIIGFTEFLKTETRPDVVRAHAFTIQNAGTALLAIVNQLLDLAGSVGTTGTLDKAPTNVRMLAETCHTMVAPLAIEKAIGSALAVDADVPALIVADGPKIQQVIVNLLTNAIKFTEAGHVTLHVATNADRLRFSVSDTGIGIPADKIDLLFQRFSRIEAERRSIRGTGLGLAIAKQIVESMQGAIGVTSNPDCGTTFWFEIPAEPIAAAAPEPVQAPAVETTVAPTGARILIADDLDLNRKLIADMLSLEGHETDCVGDGAAALRAAGERRYDLILMDMIMPLMDGLAATRAIRALPAPACDVPIIALTAHSFKEQLDSCIAAGMDATLTKPMSLDVLTATVRSWTQGRRAA